MNSVRQRAHEEIVGAAHLALAALEAEEAVFSLRPEASREEAEAVLYEAELLRTAALDRARELYRWLAQHVPDLEAP